MFDALSRITYAIPIRQFRTILSSWLDSAMEELVRVYLQITERKGKTDFYLACFENESNTIYQK